MTNNIQNLSSLQMAATSGTPPKAQTEGQAPPADQVTLGQAPAAPEPPRFKKLVVEMDVNEALLTPDAQGNVPIQNLEPVFLAKPEVAKQDPAHVPHVKSAQFSPEGGDLLVVPVPPHTNTSKFIAVPLEVPDELFQPTGETNKDGSARRGIDDFDAKLTPHDAIIKRPSDYHNDLKEAYEGGQKDALPQGYTRVVANSKFGQIVEMGSGLVGKIGMVGANFGNMVLAGWNHWMAASTAGTLAGVAGAVGVLTSLDAMRKAGNERDRVVYLKGNYEAGESRQSLLKSAPEAGPKYIEALKSQFNAEQALLEPQATLKEYDAAIKRGTKKEEKDKLDPGQKETLKGLREEREKLNAQVEALQAKLTAATEAVQAVRSQLPPDKAAKFDEKLAALAPQLQHYEGARGEQLTMPMAQLRALEAEGVGVVPMETPQGVQNVPLDAQIKQLDGQVKMQGVQAAASGLGMTCGILATLGVGCPPLLAAAAVLLPMAGMLYMVGKPLAMLGKMLWHKITHKDRTPTPDKAISGAKAKPEGPRETAAWDKAMGLRADLLKADKTAAEGYLSSMTKIDTTRQKIAMAQAQGKAEEAGKLQADLQKTGLELTGFEKTLDTAAPGVIGQFKEALFDLGQCAVERHADAALKEQFNKDLLSSGPVTRSAENLGLTDAQTSRVLRTLLLSESGHQESVGTVRSWMNGPAQNSPEASLAKVVINTSKALAKGDDPNRVVEDAKTQSAAPTPAPATPEPQAQQPAAPAQPTPTVTPQETQAQMEQYMLGMVQAAIQGNPQADAELSRLAQAAQQGDAKAAQMNQVAQAIIGQISHESQVALLQATPEQLGEAHRIQDLAAKQDPEAQKAFDGWMTKAQAGDPAAAGQVNVMNALVLSARLGLPTDPAVIKANFEQAQAQQQPATAG